MNDLIQQLEQASAGNRELDLEIAMSLETVPCVPFKEYQGMYWAERECRKTVGTMTVVEERTGVTASHYTTSLDAALALVPEGWGWSVADIKAIGESYDGGGQPWAEIWVRGGGTPRLEGMWGTAGGRAGINAATPALALCIAALKAIQAEKTNDG